MIKNHYLLLAAAIMWCNTGHAQQASLQAQTRYVNAYYNSGGYLLGWHTLAIDLKAAQNLKLTGKGVSIAVFDTGIDPNNTKLAGNLLQGWNIYGNNGAGSYQVTQDNGWGHGTFVSTIIAGNMNATGNLTTYGIAPDAKIMPIQIFDQNGQGNWTDSQFYTALNYAMTGVLKYPISGMYRGGVFNNSWNSYYTLSDLGNNTAWINSAYKMSLYGWNLAAQRNILNVWAAGNYGRPDPGYFATMPSVDPRLASSWIVVVATDMTGAIASWSNRCGIAADYCMAAPGQMILGTYTNASGKPTLAGGSGTSFAAPQVTASSALLWQYWPWLKASDIQSILFRSADKSGIYADRSIYGQGMLNLTRAFDPIGTLRLTTTKAVTAGSGSLAGTYIAPSGVLDGAIASALNGVKVIVVDDFNRGYEANLGAGVVRQQRNGMWGDQLATFNAEEIQRGNMTSFAGSANGYSSSFHTAKSGSIALALGSNVSASLAYGPFAAGSIKGNDIVLLNSVGNPYMNMAPNGQSAAVRLDWGRGHSTQIGAFTNTFPTDQLNLAAAWLPQISGANIEHTVRGNATWFSANLGYVSENHTILGSRSGGNLELGRGSRTVFAGMSGGIKIGSWNMFGGANAGYTKADSPANSLVTSLRDLVTGNVYAGLTKQGVLLKDDRLGLVVGLPLNLVSGRMRMHLPTSQDDDGNVLFTDRDFRLKPAKLEWTAQAFYNTKFGQNADLGMGLGARFNAADTKSGTEVIAMARYKLRF